MRGELGPRSFQQYRTQSRTRAHLPPLRRKIRCRVFQWIRKKIMLLMRANEKKDLLATE
jgi:hypothetical protein